MFSTYIKPLVGIILTNERPSHHTKIGNISTNQDLIKQISVVGPQPLLGSPCASVIGLLSRHIWGLLEKG